MPTLTPPEDKSITTLYIGNTGEFMTETDLRDHFYQFGEIRSISLVAKQQCGFVCFTKRESAELAAEKSFNKLILLGRRLTVRWGRGGGGKSKETPAAWSGVPGLPSLPVVGGSSFFMGPSSAPDVLPPGVPGGSAGPSGVYYPSMDPMRMGGGGGSGVGGE